MLCGWLHERGSHLWWTSSAYCRGRGPGTHPRAVSHYKLEKLDIYIFYLQRPGLSVTWMCMNSLSYKNLPLIVTRLRLDVNNTNDCKTRSFRFKNTNDGNCIHCNVTQSVHHIILDCYHSELEQIRKTFLRNIVTMYHTLKICLSGEN